jgi:hypothetical protein
MMSTGAEDEYHVTTHSREQKFTTCLHSVALTDVPEMKARVPYPREKEGCIRHFVGTPDDIGIPDQQGPNQVSTHP